MGSPEEAAVAVLAEVWCTKLHGHKTSHCENAGQVRCLESGPGEGYDSLLQVVNGRKMKRIILAVFVSLFLSSIASAEDPPDFGNVVMQTFCERAGGTWTGRLCRMNGDVHVVSLKEALGNSFEIIKTPDGRWLFAKKPVMFLYLGPPILEE